MKILQLIPGFPTGGAEKVVLTYLRHFMDDPQNECVCISLTPNKGRIYETQIEIEKLPVIFMNDYKAVNNLVVRRVKQIRALRKKIKEINPDVIHMHLNIVWLVSLALCGLRHRRLFHTLHSEPDTILFGRHRYINWLCYKLFDITPIALNIEQSKRACRLLWGMPCEVLGNGVDIECFKQIQKEDARKKYGITENDFVIGSIGRLTEPKNFDFALEIVSKVINKTPARYMIVGSGILEKSLREKAKSLGIDDKVEFLGNRQDIPDFLAAIDVFLFPSIYEGLGIVFIEAQAAGKKCVISDRIPKEAIVTDNVISLSLNETADKWCDAVLYFDPPYATHINELKDYDVKTIMTGLMKIYEREI